MPKTTGLNLTFTKCALKSREPQWNKWYDEIHVPDLLACGAFWAITRWEVLMPSSMHPRLGFTHIEVGQIAGDDPDAEIHKLAGKAPEWRKAGRIDPFHVVDDISTFKPVGKWADKGVPSNENTGLFVIFNRCSDPSKVDEWHDWLDNVHLPECMEAGGFPAVSRWVRLHPEHHRPNHIVLYDLQGDDLEKGLRAVSEINQKWEATGQIPVYHSGGLMFIAKPAGKWGAAGCQAN
ncbi:hypothetical protein M1O29_01055 [Dehalococcoidia bacterium]|nr:hypothetical protein [Dehalococcoidia bacterium]